MAYLILVRHGKSEWNKLGLWTGLTDVSLAQEGVEEARNAGVALQGIHIDKAYCSALTRAQQTCREIQHVLKCTAIEPVCHAALNERDYGDYTGKNKWEVKEEVGEEQFQNIRRGWDVPIPNGESLKDVHARVSTYYTNTILPDLQAGHTVLVTAHGNSLRALVKHLEDLNEEDISNLEIGTGEVHLYSIDTEGTIQEKEIRSINKEKKNV